MDKEEIINKTIDYVNQTLGMESSECDSSHDLWHVKRVYNNALKIAKNEKDADLFVVQLAALLHDIADWKFHDGDDNVGSKVAREWLEKMNVDEHIMNHVCQIIKDISFKGSGVRTSMKTKEGMIVQDADRLDAIGAIGVARAFAYGGHKGREMHNPNIKPEKHDSFEQYKSSSSPTINHFYEKLFLLKDLMNTETAKEIAEKKHKFMERFLKEFFDEIK